MSKADIPSEEHPLGILHECYPLRPDGTVENYADPELLFIQSIIDSVPDELGAPFEDLRNITPVDAPLCPVAKDDCRKVTVIEPEPLGVSLQKLKGTFEDNSPELKPRYVYVPVAPPPEEDWG